MLPLPDDPEEISSSSSSYIPVQVNLAALVFPPPPKFFEMMREWTLLKSTNEPNLKWAVHQSDAPLQIRPEMDAVEPESRNRQEPFSTGIPSFKKCPICLSWASLPVLSFPLIIPSTKEEEEKKGSLEKEWWNL